MILPFRSSCMLLLLGLALVAVPAVGAAQQVRQLESLIAQVDGSGASMGVADLRGALDALTELGRELRGEWTRLRAQRLGTRLYELLEARGRSQGSPALILEALRGRLEQAPEDLGLKLELCRTLEEFAHPVEAQLELEELWYHGDLDAAGRRQVGRALLDLHMRLAGGEAGHHLEAARRLGESLLEDLQGEEQARVQLRLAEIARIQRRFQAALALTEAADRQLTLDASQHRQLVLLRRFAEGRRRQEVQEASPSSYFTIQLKARVPDSVPEKLLACFERAREQVGQDLGVFPEGNLLVRVLVDEDYLELLSPRTLGVREEAGIVLRLPPRASASTLEATIFHEYAHHVLARASGGKALPRWFQEGVALWVEPGSLPLSLYRDVLSALQARTLPGAAQLREFAPGSVEQARLYYACAALRAARMVEARGTQALGAVARRVARGESFSRAVRALWGSTPEELHGLWEGGLLEQIRSRLREARGEAPPESRESLLELRVEGGESWVVEEEDYDFLVEEGP